MSSYRLGVFYAITLIKFIDTAGGIYQFMFTGKKWVAGRTNFYIKVTACRAGVKAVTANAGYGSVNVIRV